MSIPVFPWPCATGSSGGVDPRILKSQFGEGYAQRLPDGLNAKPRTWDATFTKLSPETKQAICDFLDSLDYCRPFLWARPGESTPRKWVCEEGYKDTPDDNGLLWTVTATFLEVP